MSALVATLTLAAWGPPEAERYLRLAMGRTFSRCIIATSESRDPFGNPKRRVRTEVRRDLKGRMSTTILAPREIAGVEMRDDGDRMTVRIPPRKLLLDADSPARGEPSADERLPLVRSNYRLRLEPASPLFGRNTVLLSAFPRNRGVPQRRYWLDAETGFPLRHEWEDDSGVHNVFEVKEVRFLDRLPAGSLGSLTGDGYERVRSSPSLAYTPELARDRAGFIPVIPSPLPYGFRIIRASVNDSADWRSVTFILSDGLVRAAVYEWKGQAREPVTEALGGRAVGRVGDVMVMVVSDDGSAIRTRLLDAFLARE